MSGHRLRDIGAIVVLVAVNLYWWRREQSVHEGLSVSRNWAASSEFSRRDVQEATEAADTSVDELSEEIERLHDRLDSQDAELAEYSTRLGTVRARWAELWWDAVTAERVTFDEPTVITFVIPGGETEDAQALAKRTANGRLASVVGASGDGTFVVTVGDELTDHLSAADIAQELATEVGGGAGGTACSAMGGGATGDLQRAIDDVEKRLEERPPFV